MSLNTIMVQSLIAYDELIVSSRIQLTKLVSDSSKAEFIVS